MYTNFVLFIADTFSRNQLSPATVKLLHFEPLYSTVRKRRDPAILDREELFYN